MLVYKRILVPVDGSPTSIKALKAALAIVRDGDARIRLVHSVDEMAYVSGFESSADVVKLAHDAGAQLLKEALAVATAAGAQADTRLIEFPGARLGETIADEARKWEADLIVVGTHGRRGLSRMMLGSGAEQVIRLSPVPVLVIRGGDNE